MTPDRWVAALKQAGYGAAYCPVTTDDDAATVKAYVKAAEKADIVIAEVGAWSNPLSSDTATRTAALERCKAQLALAERVGARCCVNISGSRGEPWDGPHPDNLTPETFDMVVAVVREIIDAVKPRRTFYTLEPMPWMYPQTAESYRRLIDAIDRPQFGVHIDIVNVINSPERYFDTAGLIRRWFGELGPHVRSCHAKDSLLSSQLTTHLDEVRPGLGNVDYRTLLQELNRLDPDTPLMIEHLKTEEAYRRSAEYIRSVAREAGLSFR
jgi:sugar phosphate isomerase/epimerase